MAMGLGCNAAGVVGCRIIDSPRERLIAILTNSMVPCNGRFPTLITLITLLCFSSGTIPGGMTGSLLMAGALTGFLLLGICATLLSSLLLSKTILKGLPSSFTLELPPYRRPQIGKVLLRSVFDRTLFVLLRAVSVAAPAGLLLWLLANLTLEGNSLLTLFSSFLDPLGQLLGMDGMILVGFLLGFPANEIVLPIILMGYLQTSHLTELSDFSVLFHLFTAHGWTIKTTICTAVFCLFHWPCSTTCLTIKKETGSLRWTLAAILLPTFLGCVLCFLIELLF
ncbi:MAG: nucleoside recognition domain-containing protein [Clostridium sp.]|nr:nucleoside recognition domain-containing protein [Clostridium sp.]